MKYGHIHDHFDHRDVKFVPETHVTLPRLVDLRKLIALPILDQLTIGSCTSQALANAHLFAQKKFAGGTDFFPSRLFIYYYERYLEGTVSEDSGAQIRDGAKVLAKYGVPPETEWPYVVSKFTVAPPQKAVADAKKHVALQYQSVTQDLTHVKTALYSGFPVVFGFTVYASFESDAVANTGIVPMPKPREQVLGGHAVLAVGYDDSKQALIVQNSWGSSWGDHGFFYLPYGFVTNTKLSSDYWVFNKVEE